MATAGTLAMGQRLPLPSRSADAPGGTAWIQRVADLELAAREKVLIQAMSSGNVPDSTRCLAPIAIRCLYQGNPVTVGLFASVDYLAIGTDADACRMPLSPGAASTVASAADCLLPTPTMVDAIYRAASVQLRREPMKPGPAMTRPPYFLEHNRRIEAQLRRDEEPPFPEKLVAGHKKDVVQTPRGTVAGKVSIYGWHRADRDPIQPLYSGHTDRWVDYSHGIRLIHRFAWVDRLPGTVDGALHDPDLTDCLGDGSSPDCPASHWTDGERAPPSKVKSLPGFTTTGARGEQRMEWRSELGTRVRVQAPATDQWRDDRPTHWILYALPNGNTIEQTTGRRAASPDEWRFEIQHIAAQIRWLRGQAVDRNWIVVFLEAKGLSWPAWRRQQPDRNDRVLKVVEEISARTGMPVQSLTLTGHSGGGSFVFGFINAHATIPATVERIAFLDSNYAYRSDLEHRHAEKLRVWLRNDPRRCLLVLAYNDGFALLNGKSFISPEGGTWGRSLNMIDDLQSWLPMARFENESFIVHRGMSGRVQVILKKNPDRAILHTVQVERNGFIHAALAGTPLDSHGYFYYGPPVYTRLIESE